MFFYRILNVLRICYNILSSEKKTDTKLHIHMSSMYTYTHKYTQTDIVDKTLGRNMPEYLKWLFQDGKVE